MEINDEKLFKLSTNIKMNNEPCTITFNLDTYPLGYGLKYFDVIYKGESLKFTADEILTILMKLKESLPVDK